MGRGWVVAIVVGVVVGGCGSGGDGGASRTLPPEAAPPAAESPCAEGFALDADGACMETPAPATCAGGTRPRVGSSTCEPVGWKSTCPAGTKRDASGFGCIDPAPTAPCAGATREAYGEATCVPVGDCSAPFPPAGAIVVDGSLADAQLDATHVRTLAEGIAAASSGATVAIETGVYDEAVTLTRPVKIVGRCAANVELRAPAASTTPGIDIRTTATVRGITVTGHTNAVDVKTGADATVESVVVRDARYAGISVQGGRATIRGSKVEGTRPQADGRGGFGLTVKGVAETTVDDSTLTGGVQGALASGPAELAMTHVVITRQAADPAGTSRPVGVATGGGSRVSLARSVIRDLVADSAATVEADSTVELTETIVRGVTVDGSAARGYGLVASYGGHLVVRSSLVSAVESVSVLARDEGSSVELTDSVVLGPGIAGVPPSTTPPAGKPTSDGRGAGVSIKGKATGSLDGVAIVGSWGFSLHAESATIDVKRSLVDAPRGLAGVAPARSVAYGFVVDAATASVSDVSVTRCAAAGVTVGKNGKLTGDRLYVRDVIEGVVISAGAGLAVGAGGHVDLDASVIDGATASGVVITEGAGSYVRLARSSIHGTRQTPEGFGHGVTVRLGARVVLTATSVVENPGIGVAADGGRALVEGATIARNAIGIHAQRGSFFVELDDTDAESLADGEVRVIPSTRFASNGTRIGSGEVPLPAPVLP